jgi:hypothetical protein
MIGLGCEAPSTDKSPSNDVQSGSLYRNTKYKFRIKFPSGWEQASGDGPHVVRKAWNTGGNSIVIVVNEFPPNLITAAMDIEDIVDLDELQTSLKEKFPDAVIIDHGFTYIGNVKAFRYKFSASYAVLDKKIKMIMLNYQILHNGILYTLTTSEGNETINSISTFVFEDY